MWKTIGLLAIFLLNPEDFYSIPKPFARLRIKKLTKIDDTLEDTYNSIATKKRDESSNLIITELRKIVALLKSEVYPQSSVIKEPE